eukprot:COSAG06_NODE_29272_length_559_cov_1.345652_1_plen_56_part_10
MAGGAFVLEAWQKRTPMYGLNMNVYGLLVHSPPGPSESLSSFIGLPTASPPISNTS